EVRRGSLRWIVALALAVAAPALLLAGGAQARTPALRFTAPFALPHSLPPGDMNGGEPSVAYDPANHNYVYVVAPGASSEGPGGIDMWISHDAGRSWPVAKNIGAAVIG